MAKVLITVIGTGSINIDQSGMRSYKNAKNVIVIIKSMKQILLLKH